MNDRAVRIPADTEQRQREAADPFASAWVSANAGSGKTFVLTRRVLRLLLAGAEPGAILCLTYTKAAAAEMRHRVSAELGKWARLDDVALARELDVVTGIRPDRPALERARTLFARALETPGGLKILTIHAFCEAVLQRFPREAGVPVDFTVIEEAARDEVLQAARESVLAEGLAGHAEIAEAVAYLFTHLSDTQIETGIARALETPRGLAGVLADPDAAKRRVHRMLGVAPDASEASLTEAALAGMLVQTSEFARVFAVCPPDPTKSRFEDNLARIDPAAPSLDQLFTAFLKKDGALPSNLVKGAIRKAEPELSARFDAEAERLAAIFDARKAIRLVQRSTALIDVMHGIALRYEEEKRRKSLLDFDDLVSRAGALLADPELGEWVRYKLDAGIEHILVDEGQDTNAQQWAVIDALAADFYTGDGAAQRPKTLFAVGDPKQSIYSFQGAEPKLFIDKGAAYAQQARAAGQNFVRPTLRTSFRSLPEILAGVDRVSAREDIAMALLAEGEPIVHESARVDNGGTIDVWATFAEPELVPGDSWPTEPIVASASAARQLADRIAEQVERWLTDEAPLAQRGRAIRPDDILILVQSRKAVFSEIVRALKRKGIPSPGADRLPVTTHIAVRDLLGLADILLNPRDDLLLSAILRSPLYGVSEETLFDIAAGRDAYETVWDALGRSEDLHARSAHLELVALRSRVELDRPYTLFAHVLYALGGLKRFHARLGTEVDDVFAELLDLALDHEGSDQPSLTGFLARMRASDVTIKRDLGEEGGGVRVMTVHGAKGLEAPIVILADAADPTPALTQAVYYTEFEGGPTLLFPGKRDNLSAASFSHYEAAKAKQDAEYWRKLYVAMTRAEDTLIVGGTTSSGKRYPGTWHDIVAGRLAEGGAINDGAGPGEIQVRFPALVPAPKPAGPIAGHQPSETVPLTLAPPPPYRGRETLSPSRLGAELAPGAVLQRSGEALVDAEAARRRGLAVHALLQHLGRVPPDLRAAVAAAAAGALLPDDPELAAGSAAQALALLGHPDLSALFGPGSRAEVPFALDGTRNGKPIRLVGRMDRLVVAPDHVLVVDFKSDAVPPTSAAEVPPAYLQQLALYRSVGSRLFPALRVDAAILWTATAALMPLPAAALDPLAAPFTLG